MSNMNEPSHRPPEQFEDQLEDVARKMMDAGAKARVEAERNQPVPPWAAAIVVMGALFVARKCGLGWLGSIGLSAGAGALVGVLGEIDRRIRTKRRNANPSNSKG